MNIDIDTLSSLKPRVIQLSQLSPEEIQIDISIDGNAILPDLQDMQSDGTEDVSKYAGRQCVKEEYMPREFRPVHALTVKPLGRNSKSRRLFNYEGAWFWVTSEAHSKLEPYANPRYTILVRWGSNGFETMVIEAEHTAETVSLKEKYFGKPAASDKIPILQQPQSIKTIGFRKWKGIKLSSHVQLAEAETRYWLPASVTEIILMKLKEESGIEISEENVQSDCLNKYFIHRPGADSIRVSGKPNPEPLISITDADENVITKQPETNISLESRKRKRDESVSEFECGKEHVRVHAYEENMRMEHTCEQSKDGYIPCLCDCMCVTERDRKIRERESILSHAYVHLHSSLSLFWRLLRSTSTLQMNGISTRKSNRGCQSSAPPQVNIRKSTGQRLFQCVANANRVEGTWNLSR